MSMQPILYAEDDPNEVFFLTRSLKKLGFHNPIHHVQDGQEAIDYLSGTGSFADRQQHPLPSVLLLDLKMPRRDGLEVLQWLRGQQQFRELPVVVLSSSDLLEDQTRASQFGANAFLTKSFDWTRVFNALHQALHSAAQKPPQAPTPCTCPEKRA